MASQKVFVKKYSRMNQIFVEESLYTDLTTFFTGCLSQILFDPFMHTFSTYTKKNKCIFKTHGNFKNAAKTENKDYFLKA